MTVEQPLPAEQGAVAPDDLSSGDRPSFLRRFGSGLTAAAMAIGLLGGLSGNEHEASAQEQNKIAVWANAYHGCLPDESGLLEVTIESQLANTNNHPLEVAIDVDYMPGRERNWESFAPNEVRWMEPIRTGLRAAHEGEAFYVAKLPDGSVTPVHPGINGVYLTQTSCDGSPHPIKGDNGVGGGGRKIPLQIVEGEDRYATAVAISQENYDQADTVVLATGSDFPDALAGGPLAATEGGPLLLSPTAGLTDNVAQELTRLGTEEVILLGGHNALSPAVENRIRNMGITTTRIAGVDRYDTAAQVAEHVMNSSNTTTTEVFLVSGRNFPDALSVAPIAARDGKPIILTGSELPASSRNLLAKRREQLNRVIIAGGGAAVSSGIEGQARLLASSSSQRLFGQNRYATSAAIARWDITEQNHSPTTIHIATGRTFADALSAGPAVAQQTPAAFVLVDGQNSITATESYDFIAEVKAADTTEVLQKGVIFGGRAAINDSVINTISVMLDS